MPHRPGTYTGSRFERDAGSLYDFREPAKTDNQNPIKEQIDRFFPRRRPPLDLTKQSTSPLTPLQGTAPTEAIVPVEVRFRELVAQWERERPRGADIHVMAAQPAFRAIVEELRWKAVRFLLAELETRPRHWVVALHEITGENPVPPEDEGNAKKMAEAWIAWGKQPGNLREVDR
jgi:hypothetical protein